MKPIFPEEFAKARFFVSATNLDNITLEKEGSGHHVYIPVNCIRMVIPSSPTREATLLLNGKVEWVEDQKGQRWEFVP